MKAEAKRVAIGCCSRSASEGEYPINIVFETEAMLDLHPGHLLPLSGRRQRYDAQGLSRPRGRNLGKVHDHGV